MSIVVHDVDKSTTLAKVLITAAYTGTPIEVSPVAQGANKSKEFLADFPLGRLPSARLQNGSGNISGTNTIIRYLAQAANGQLYGETASERAQVDAWLEWTILDIDLPAAAWLYPIKGFIQNNPAATNKAKGDIRKALEQLNAHLATRTFLVGQRVSLADIAVSLSLLELYTTVLDAGYRKQFAHTNRWFNTCIHQPQFHKVLGDVTLATKMAVAPNPPKEEPPKKEAKKEAKPKEAPKPKEEKKEAPADDEEAPKPKAKNPLDALPPSKFNLEDWKREYSNNDTRSHAIPWLWSNYDPEGFSIWLMEYKYPTDLAKTYMAANMVGGWLQRCDPLRRYGFGSIVICGGEGPPPNFEIFGVWIFRGKEIPFEMTDTPDFDSYTFTRADLNDAAQKELIEDYLAWDGKLGGRTLNQGKAFK